MKRRHKPNKGSWNEFLSEMEKGEVFWFETTRTGYAHDMRVANTPQTRRPKILAKREFSTQLYRAVPTSTKDDVLYLIKLTRVK